MPDTAISATRRDAVIELVRRLRRLDDTIGVKHSGIALDVGLLLYQVGEGAQTVREISTRTGYSGPTVRLVLTRLRKAGAIVALPHAGKTQAFQLSARGRAGFDSYVALIWSFASAAAASPGD